MIWKIAAGKSHSKSVLRSSNLFFASNQKALRPKLLGSLLLGSALLTGCGGGSSSGSGNNGTVSLRSIATFNVKTTGGEVAEIASVTPDGKTLLYTDSATSRIGFVNIADLNNISQLGFYEGDGSPTSVAVTKDGLYAIAVFEQSNKLVVLKVSDRSVVRTINLPGQPDCVALSSDGRYAAIAIENQRTNEDNPLPQTPAGSVVVVSLSSDAANWTIRNVTLNLPNTVDFPTDAEPEFIDINANNDAAVTLQENNGIAIINLPSASIKTVFSAGRTTHPADLKDNDTISFTDTLRDARRQPDGIAWTPSGNLITANEGDYDLDTAEGRFVGGRNFTIFSPTGKVVYDEPGDMEKAVAAAGRYDDKRSDAKGTEPENVKVATINNRPLAFVALERADSLAVYRLDSDSRPVLSQILPTGDEPEGIVAVPQRNLVITANEGDGTLSFFTP